MSGWRVWMSKLGTMIFIGASIVTLTFFLVGLTPERSKDPFTETIPTTTTVRYTKWIHQIVSSGFTQWGNSRSVPDVTALIKQELPITAQVGSAAWVLTWISALGLAILLSSLRWGAKFYLRWIYPAALALPKLPVIFLFFLGSVKLGLAATVRVELLAVAVLAILHIPATTALWLTGIERVRATEFVRVARSRGLGWTRVWLAHIVPNVIATSGILSRAAFGLAEMIVGSVLVESIFSLGGVAGEFIKSVRSGQCELAATAAVIFFVPIAVGVLVAEGVVLWLDPKQRLEHEA